MKKSFITSRPGHLSVYTFCCSLFIKANGYIFWGGTLLNYFTSFLDGDHIPRKKLLFGQQNISKSCPILGRAILSGEAMGKLKVASLCKMGGGRVVRWSWVNFQCRGVLLVWIRVGQGPTALAVGAGGGCLYIFTFIYPFSSLSPSLWETTRYRLKYCLKGSLRPKTTNQPTNPL